MFVIISAITQVLAGIQCPRYSRRHVSFSWSDPHGKPGSLLCHECRCLWRLSDARNAGISSSHGLGATFYYSRNGSMWFVSLCHFLIVHSLLCLVVTVFCGFVFRLWVYVLTISFVSYMPIFAVFLHFLAIFAHDVA